ncbi:molecular chaperone Tir [Clostridiales bacterium PH28_bin88]|nr:molecular chaperone Tir [Clostridiales bacterium PH28_bin88]
MGGGGGSLHGIGDLETLVERAKEELREGEKQGKKNVFISFAYEDIDYVNLLRAQAKNEKSPIEFNDWSVSEPFNSERSPYIKQKIGERIAQSSLTVVYLSDKTPSSHWVEWEIEESLRRGKQVIGVFAGETRPAKLPKAIEHNTIKCVPWAKLSETISGLE